ncbi:helix-turn-helix transcriptional regulator [Saccharothrix deserti]|uniref:helix-turn-helix transcriptional regulator n=1 Tax=Saccharothrix deserti TaxID=2593674 RepID=UPI00131D543A|nr:LuxR C-terminal-related transcriptional regulator [Saccharothrix deserti]
MTVVVGVDGSGRTYRLGQLADASGTRAWWVGSGDLAAGLDAAREAGTLVVADDAHRLPPEVLRALVAAARSGVRVLVARRPTIGCPELADLDEAAAAGGVEVLEPLDRDGVGALVAAVTGRPASPVVAAAVHEMSAGLPGVAAAVASTLTGTSRAASGVPVPALLARVQRRFAVLPRQVGAVARVLALRLGLSDDVLAAAAEMPVEELPGVLRTLRDEGMLVPGGERMIPAMADAVLGELSAAERRRLHDGAAGALAAAGADPLVTAAQLRAARVRTPAAAEVYRQAGELTRFADPAAALAWFDDATEAGAEPSAVAAGRAEAGALLGLPPDADLPAPPGAEAAARVACLAGAAAAHDGRADRAADLLFAAPPPGPLLAVPVLVGTGRLADARTATREPDGAPAAMRFAEAVLTAVRDPDAAVPLLIEAAEVAERATPVAVLPDTPHAIGAVVAVLAGDTAAAEYLLDRAARAGIGGPAAAERHRLMLAWARMRAGRYDTALAELARPVSGELPARERLLRAAIAAGAARRRGDIAGLRAVWGGVEPVLARRAVDLWQLEPVEELLVAAARLRQGRRIEPIIELFERIVDQLGRPPAWAVALGWLRVQVAVAGDDQDTAAAQARRLTEITAQARRREEMAAGPAPRPGEPATDTAPAAEKSGHPAANRLDWLGEAGDPAELAAADRLGRLAATTGPVGHRAAAQCAAATAWSAVLAGTPAPPDQILAVTEQLVAAQLPWEAARLAGQAAIHATDPVTVRWLLERARELSDPDSQTNGAVQTGGLSERELAVAKLVLAGSTHREIGAQLYIAPKTVEHHVARIRTKLGAGSRAELLAALREILADQA